MEKVNLFVVTPFSGDANRVWTEALMPAVNRINLLQKEFTIQTHRADLELFGLEFSLQIHTHLREADICLCDITGLNPNVMYEIGYARACEKKTVIIRQGEDKIPVDISDKYIHQYDPKNMVSLSQFLENALPKAVEAVRARRRSRPPFYSVTCFSDRTASDLADAIQRAEQSIDILETNVSTVADRYIKGIKAGLEAHENLKVRILTLNPDSGFVNNRAIQLGVPIGEYRAELHAGIQKLLEELSPYGGKFALRIYDDFPNQITFIVDRSVYSCSMARVYRSRNLCTFKLDTQDPGAERSFQFHFGAVWAIGMSYTPFGK